MADGIPITAGSGTTVATDDCGAPGHVQLVKLAYSANGDASLLQADAQGLATISRRDLKRIAVDSAGLTTTTPSYAAGDQLGNEFVFADAARSTGGTGMLVGIVLSTQLDAIGACDVVISRSSLTLAGNNSAWTVNYTDTKAIIAIVSLATAMDLGTTRVAQAFNLAVPYDCAATSLYASVITRVAHAVFAATTDVQLQLFVERN